MGPAPSPEDYLTTLRILDILPDLARAERRAQGLTYRETAEQMGLTPSVLHKFETDERRDSRRSTERAVLQWLLQAARKH